jgi:lipopolysaccharide transport system ATP-binding protein
MPEIEEGDNKFRMELNIGDLALGEYIVSIDITIPNEKYFDRCDECLCFDVIKSNKRSRQLEQEWNYGFFTLPVKRL